MEIWKPIDGYEGYYEVSTLGNVRSLERQVKHYRGGTITLKSKMMKQTVDSYGYCCVNLSLDGKTKMTKVHRLVAEAYVDGKSEDKNLVCHKDGTRHNNLPDNLRWDTIYGNNSDRVVHGTSLLGSRNHNAILSESDIAEIKASPLSGPKEAKLRGVSSTTIYAIRNGETWSHV